MATTQTPTYWVTLHGTHRHANQDCANVRRAIKSGYPTPTSDMDLPLCSFCCEAPLVAADSKARAEAAPAMCPNQGVEHPQRYQSKCRSCGKLGTVNRNTGSLRAHKPL